MVQYEPDVDLVLFSKYCSMGALKYYRWFYSASHVATTGQYLVPPRIERGYVLINIDSLYLRFTHKFGNLESYNDS